MKKTTLRILGFTTWAVVIFLFIAGLRNEQQRITSGSDDSLNNYLFGGQSEVLVRAPAGKLRIHDPVFLKQDGSWVQVGYVQAISAPLNDSSNSSSSAILNWHSSQFAPKDCRFVLHRNRGRLEDVIATMLPPETRAKIQERLATTMKQHGQELSNAFVPLVQNSLKRSLPIIENEFRLSVKRHRGEIEALGDRWNDEVVSERLVPLARREIVPIVRKHGEPTAEEIGRELWDRASIFSFGWRAAYDGLPLVPRKDLVREEWTRFVENEAVPVFEQRMDEIVDSIQKIVSDVAANPKVRKELTDVAVVIANDPEAQKLVRQILKESLVDNQRLKDSWKDVWSSDEAQQAFELAGDRLEPVIRKIGDDLIGSRELGINPNFARVLRSQILGKDRQWIVAIPVQGDRKKQQLRIETSTDSMPYPIVYLANPDNTQLAITNGTDRAENAASMEAISE
ncbi:hypothetical protein N9A80_01425 [Rhodopirellula sp.]|nr:hypothetical protein [Rhodopirellula sp.]